MDSFTWLGQLRYYVEENSLQVRMINASIEYAYEYLGTHVFLHFQGGS